MGKTFKNGRERSRFFYRAVVTAGWLLLQAVWALCLTKTVVAADNATKLESLARAEFAELSPPELAFFTAVASGDRFSMASAGATGAEPSAETEVPTLDAHKLAWLATNTAASSLLPRRGIQLTRTKLSGRLNLAYGKLAVPLELNACEIPDGIDLRHAQLVELDLTGSHVSTLSGDQVRIERNLIMAYGFIATGEVRLHLARIGGTVDASGGHFLHNRPDALFADGIQVEGDMLLRYEFHAANAVSLDDARIKGNLDFEHANIRRPGDVALQLGGVHIGGDLLLGDIEVQGGILLNHADVLGSLEAAGARLIFPGGTAIKGYSLDVGGDCRFLGATIVGGVVMESATIGRDLSFADAHFFDPSMTVDVVLQNASVARRFRWTGIKTDAESTTRLDLRSAVAGTLYDDAASWPKAGELLLHGFEYKEIHDDAPLDATSRMDWLRRQPTDRFRAQPYEQIASVLKASGLSADSRQILIAKEHDRARQMTLTHAEWFWFHIFGPMIGYGYESWRALFIMLAVILGGAVLFQIGYWAGLMTATKEAEFVYESGHIDPKLSHNYPKFNALVYSLDVFTPLTYLHQADYWMPNPSTGSLGRIAGIPISFGELLRVYLWIHIVAGWTLTSLLVAGITGMVENH